MPTAPKVLGRLFGAAAAGGALELAALTELCEPVEDAEPRRAFAAPALAVLKVRRGIGIQT